MYDTVCVSVRERERGEREREEKERGGGERKRESGERGRTVWLVFTRKSNLQQKALTGEDPSH